ncbi:MAG TPA: ABC transporter substrate-binding protein [Gaiellaceae bacterium]
MSVSLLMIIAGAGLLGAAASGDRSRPALRNGGTFRIALSSDYGPIDPALSGVFPLAVESATCALLMRPADKSGPAGLRLVPEVATGFPKISRDGKTYMFTLRKSFRFNTGARLTAAGFAHAIDRILDPKLQSEQASTFQDIVGAQDVLDGHATHASGVQPRGYKLVVHLTAPAPDFTSRLSGATCSVLPTLPVDPEGIGAPFPAAGPYYVAQYVPGLKMVLKRNRFYHGRRPHHVDQFVASFFSGFSADGLRMVEKGQADWAETLSTAFFNVLSLNERKSKSQFFNVAGLTMRYVVMNTSRGIFKNNPRLRRAVNFAIDRPALVQQRGGAVSGRPADHYMPSSMPGFENVRIYPLTHPNLRKARALARGHLRSGKAVFYAPNGGPNVPVAQIVKQDLSKIGIDVEIKLIPPSAFIDLLQRPGEPYDLTLLGWGPNFYDPGAFLNPQFEGSQIKAGSNFARFSSPKYNRLLAQAARLSGQARYRAYGKLDVELARDAAPLAAFMNENALTFVSKRTGCVVVNPFLDLAAVCLKR